MYKNIFYACIKKIFFIINFIFLNFMFFCIFMNTLILYEHKFYITLLRNIILVIIINHHHFLLNN